MGAALLIAASAVGVLAGRLADSRAQIAQLERSLSERPIDAASTRRALLVTPSRTGTPTKPAFAIGGRGAELVELKTDLSWSSAKNFRIQIERADQGIVAVLHNLQKDSNGHARLSLNSSAFGPGVYNVAIEALDWRGNASPVAWTSFQIVAPTSR